MVRRVSYAYFMLQSIADNRLDLTRKERITPRIIYDALSLRMYRQSPFAKLPGRIRILGVTAERASKSEGMLRLRH